MESARSERVCRYFRNGSCRLGSRCTYRHERPVSDQICKYFQKGGCWFGERCRYLHILQPTGDVAVTGRRRSVPAVSASISCTPPERRGSEPALMQAEVMPRQECSTTEFVQDIPNPQHLGNLASNSSEERSQDAGSPLSASGQLDQEPEVAQETVSSKAKENDGAAASNSHESVQTVNCGICMDNVYEKRPPRDNVFGILPNCNHSFCKQCITTWRKMRDYGPDVVKSCPQCRVKSAFYVPSKYWVEGQEKEQLIAAFKERFSKKNCKYYMRYGCCPFGRECLYLHDKHARWMSFPHETEDEDDFDVDELNLLFALTLLSGDINDDDDYLDFQFYLSEDYL